MPKRVMKKRNTAISMLVDNDSFDRFPLTARQARFAPWCAHHKWTATQRAVKGNRPRAIKWVIINEHWY